MNQSSVLIDASADFPRLDQILHIAYFVPVNWGAQDKVSRSLVDFQHQREPQTEQWIRLAETLVQSIPCDVIIRALSSKESTAGGKTPLDLLCARLAKKLNAPYSPERLWKTRRTLAVKNAGGLTARRKALLGAYEFSGSNLPPNARILLVDDIVTTGATALSIAAAIRRDLPEAAIRLFVLARTNPHLVRLHLEELALQKIEEPVPVLEPNPHIDDRYFARSVAPAIVLPKERRTPPPAPATLPQPPTRQTVPEPPAPVPEPAESAVKEPEPLLEIPAQFNLDAPVQISKETPAPVQTPARTPDRPAAAATARSRSAKRILSTLANPLAIGIGVAALVFVGVFLANQFLGTEAEISRIPPPEQYIPPKPRQEPAKPPVVQKKKPQLPRGSINVPSVRLRSEPSMDAAVLPAEVRMGDPVTILRKAAVETGPDWLLVRTVDGTSGWVFSGVVTPDSSAQMMR